VKRIAILLAAMAICVGFVSAEARDAATIEAEKEIAVDMVNEAAALIAEQGLDESVPQLNDPAGPFKEGDIYIAVMNFTGLMIANPGAPFLAGKQLPMTSTDAKGNPLRMIEIAQEEGEGWFDYYWNHNEKRKVLLKTAYIKRIPGHDAYISCGVWLEE
jgi:signal transduction histidine kinase